MTAAVPSPAVTLLDFDHDADFASWYPVNDVVMGGVSHSAFERASPGVARFHGEVSLANSGGFASVRTTPRDWDTSAATAFLLRVRGDGRTYKFTIRTSDRFDGIQYQQRFTAPPGAWREVRLPVDQFVPTFRGRRVPLAAPLEPARTRAIGLMVSDRQAGSFELLVDRIAVER